MERLAVTHRTGLALAVMLVIGTIFGFAWSHRAHPRAAAPMPMPPHECGCRNPRLLEVPALIYIDYAVYVPRADRILVTW